MEIGFVNTKTCTSQLHLNPMNNMACHVFPMYRVRVALPENEALYEQTIEDLIRASLDGLIDWLMHNAIAQSWMLSSRLWCFCASTFFLNFYSRLHFLTRHASSITAVCLSHFQKKSLCDWICLIRNFFQSAPKYCIWLRAWRGPIRLVSPIFKL